MADLDKYAGLVLQGLALQHQASSLAIVRHVLAELEQRVRAEERGRAWMEAERWWFKEEAQKPHPLDRLLKRLDPERAAAIRQPADTPTQETSG